MNTSAKTLNAEQTNKAVKHIAKMLKDDADTWNSPYPQYMGFVGWDNTPMCANNRAAFVVTYGVAQTSWLEEQAKAMNDASDNRRANSAYAKHAAEANANAEKPAADLKVGDFINAVECGLKFDHQNLRRHLAHYVEGAKMDAGEVENSMADYPDYKHVRDALVKITRIEDKTAGFFDDPVNCLRTWKPQLNADGQGFEGGTASDDIEEGVNIYTLDKDAQKEAIATFYTLAVLVREPSGRCVLIDAEGYDYPRYVLLRADWRETWKTTIAAIDAEQKAEEAEAKAAAEAKEKSARAGYEARCAKWEKYLTPVSTGKDWKEQRKITKRNILTMAKLAAPGVRFTLSAYNGWGHAYDLTWTNGPTVDELDAAADFDLFEIGRDSFDSMTDCANFDRAKYTAFAEKYGSAYGEIQLNRNEAETDRNRNVAPVTPVVQNADTDTATAANADGENVTATYRLNAERNGVEIMFSGIPTEDTRSVLKAAGWRWSRFAKVWYNRDTPENREFAERISAA